MSLARATVPFTKVSGIPPEAQRQLQRNFEVAIATLAAGGGRVKVPYPKIAGLPPEAQRQIQRNFEDLVCTGGASLSNTVPAGTVITSDEFVRGVTGLTINATNQDLYAGGSAFPWRVLSSTAVANDLGGGQWIASLTGAAYHQIIADTTQPNVDVQVIIKTHPVGVVVGAIARYQDPSNFVYADYTGGGSVSYGRVRFGVQTVYATVAGGGSPLILRVKGFNISVYNGLTLLSTTNDVDVPTGRGTGFTGQAGAGSEIQSFKVTAV